MPFIEKGMACHPSTMILFSTCNDNHIPFISKVSAIRLVDIACYPSKKQFQPPNTAFQLSGIQVYKNVLTSNISSNRRLKKKKTKSKRKIRTHQQIGRNLPQVRLPGIDSGTHGHSASSQSTLHSFPANTAKRRTAQHNR